METILIYHGSNIAVQKPKILVSGFYKDFGFGFYCTRYEKQAQRWALSKNGGGIVSVYEYTGGAELNILRFDSMTDEWLDFVADCRRGLEHSYDIVEGPMADDQIWDLKAKYSGLNSIYLSSCYSRIICFLVLAVLCKLLQS